MLHQDILQALRAIRRQPSFAAVVILTIALGIAATTAVFSLVYSILIRPFPYREPDALVRVQSQLSKQGGALRGCSLLDIEDYRRLTGMIVDIGAYNGADVQLFGEGPAEVVQMAQLNPAALSILGVEPVMGRLFLPEEDRPGGDVYKAIISHQLWQSRFGSDPNIVGRPMRTNRATYTIVGVMPPGFAFPNRTALWTPLESFYALLAADRREKRRDSRWFSTIARLKPGVHLEQAQLELNAVAAQLERQFPRDNEGIRVKLATLRDVEAGNIRPYLLLLLGGVGFVLLICCVNVANLLLARAASREKELTIRSALGAGRWTIVRALIAESLVLSMLGGLLGIALAYVTVRGLVALIPVALPAWMKIEMDGTVVAVSFVLTVITGLLFGSAPALLASRVDLNGVLKEGSRGSSMRGPMKSALVVAEVSLSLWLLIGAALMIRTFIKLQRVETGFRSDGLLTARVVRYAAGTRQESAAILNSFHQRVLDALRRVPSVTSAAVTNWLPYSGSSTERMRGDLAIKGRAQEDVKLLAPLLGADVSADYFQTMRIPLVAGRLFNDSDTNTSPYVAVINQRAAKMFWPDRDPIGQGILWGPVTATNPYCRIIGVVGNVRYQAAEADNGVEIYYPLTQWPVMTAYYVIRTQSDPDTLIGAVRQAIQASEPNAAVTSIKTMERTMDESLWQRRLWGVIFTAFAVLALALAAVGLYGVMSYTVAQRTREIGIRVALGAQPGGVRRMVVREGMALAGVGVAIGLAGAVALSRLVKGLLFGVAATDPLTYAITPLLAAVACIACWIPARRAARVDPLVALREE
jgi:putative ABC transport system permease protein